MKKIHILEVLAVSFTFIILLYFSLPYFLQSQASKQIHSLKGETQFVVDHIEEQLRLQDKNTFEFGDLKQISDQYERTNEHGIYGGRGGLNNAMISFNKQFEHNTDLDVLYVMLLESNINPRRTGFKDFVSVAISNTPFEEPLTMETIKQLDDHMRNYFIDAQKKGDLSLKPNIDFLLSNSYHTSNGLKSNGFIMSFQYTKVPYDNKTE